MLIAFLGDTHFGYKWGEDQQWDSFLQSRDAIEKAIKRGADAIVQMGDLFDTRVPKPEVLNEAMKVLTIPLLSPATGLKINGASKNIKQISHSRFNGVPFIAIHGTHDRRSSGLVNPVEMMENAGLLVHLAGSTIVIEKNGEKIALHGMSTVPERYAWEEFTKWNPQPLPDMQNILLFHQSFEEYIYSPLEPPQFSFEKMPKGFPLIVNGHIHWSDVKRMNDEQTYLGTGSTIVTQVRREDMERPKYIWFYDTQTGQITNEEITPTRKIYYEKIDVTGMSDMQLRDTLIQGLTRISMENLKPPIVKIALTGAYQGAGLDLKAIKNKFAHSMLLQIEKKTEEKELEEKIKILHDIRDHRLSAEEMGIKILKDHLTGEEYDIESLFRLLADDDAENALRILENIVIVKETKIEEKTIPVVRNEAWKGWFNIKKVDAV